jgi:hypothetical protein
MSDDLVPAPDAVPGVSLRTMRLRDLPDVEVVDEAQAPDPATAVGVSPEPDARPARGRGGVPAVEPVDEAGDADGGDTVIVLQP